MSEFKLEERYMVLKLNKFSKEKKLLLQNYMRGLGIPKEAFVDCIVIEEDWPEYQAALDSIRERVEGV